MDASTSFDTVTHAPPRADLGLSLRALAALLRYPDDSLRAHLGEIRDALYRSRSVCRETLGALDGLIDQLANGEILEAESHYVHLFDSGRSTSLHLFEHVHGDSRDRGPAMIDLTRTYEAAGLMLADGELPDHLCVALEYASTQPPQQARAFVGEIAHIVNSIHQALARRESAYAAVLAAMLEIAGEQPHAVAPVAEPALDEAWQEPEAFGGCNSAGQERGPQPIHIVRKNPSTGARA